MRIELKVFEKAHGLKIEAECVQKGHGKNWRYVRAIGHRMGALGDRARDTIIDACREMGLGMAGRAYEIRKVTVLKNITGLKANEKSRMAKIWRMRLASRAYKELQERIGWKSYLYGAPMFK